MIRYHTCCRCGAKWNHGSPSTCVCFAIKFAVTGAFVAVVTLLAIIALIRFLCGDIQL
jgi:hypothetical protein